MITGHVVKRLDGYCLDRFLEFRKHGPGQTPYVHPMEVVVAGGDWVEPGMRVFPGQYDETARRSELTGPAVPYEDFVTANTPHPAAGTASD